MQCEQHGHEVAVSASSATLLRGGCVTQTATWPRGGCSCIIVLQHSHEVAVCASSCLNNLSGGPMVALLDSVFKSLGGGPVRGAARLDFNSLGGGLVWHYSIRFQHFTWWPGGGTTRLISTIWVVACVALLDLVFKQFIRFCKSQASIMSSGPVRGASKQHE